MFNEREHYGCRVLDERTGLKPYTIVDSRVVKKSTYHKYAKTTQSELEVHLRFI